MIEGAKGEDRGQGTARDMPQMRGRAFFDHVPSLMPPRSSLVRCWIARLFPACTSPVFPKNPWAFFPFS